MPRPKIACLCPTYKRPGFLANAAACFLAQDYPEDLRRLFILDDAGQFISDSFRSIDLVSIDTRIHGLPHKFDLIAERAIELWEPDVFAIWEDDDVFLPHHLSSIAEAVQNGGEYLISDQIYSTYEEPEGGTHLEDATGRFHSSWAFTVGLYDRVGGYPSTSRLDFDQQLGHMLSTDSKVEFYSWKYGPPPSYVYRWGNGIYHGSQRGEDGFWELWHELEHFPSPWIGRLVPRFDRETAKIYEERESCVGPTG